MRLRLLVVGFLALLVSGCVTPFVVACRSTAEDPKGEFKYTKRQAAVACDRAQFYAIPHLVILDKEKGTWELNPNGLLASDLERVIEDEVKSLDVLLSYRGREDADWIDWFIGFRKGLEKEEQIALYMLRRLREVKAYNDFTDSVGELPDHLKAKELSYFFPAGRKFYSMRVLYPSQDQKRIPFTAEYLEAAKKDGSLRLVDTFEVNAAQEFAKKVPHLYDSNEFSWKREDRGWLIRSYRTVADKEKPADNIVHYIEIYRKKAGDTGVERDPAVRGFLATGGSRVSMFVVDYDREGKPGYGRIDEALKIHTAITTGKDIFGDSALRDKLLDALYDHPQNNVEERPHRIKPRDQEIYTAIVRMGQARFDAWEQGTWSVPIDYRTLAQNLEIGYDKPKTPEDQRLEEREKVRRIKYFQRDFKQDGKIVVQEYWLPKPEYANRNISSSTALSDTIRVRRKGGVEESGEINYFSAHLKVIDYLYGGKWFRIVDEDNDGVFEKKRVIADPTPSTVKSTSEDFGM